jgi:hypothetical protein
LEIKIQMNKKIVILVGVLILVAAIAAGFYFNKNKKQGQDPRNEEKIPFSMEKKDLAPGELSKAFPVNLPVEAGSQTLQNYESTTSDGRKQATIVITTSKTLTQAVADYVKFFEENDWLVIEGQAEATADKSTALMKKNDARLMIVSENNVETKQKTVEITLVQPPKQK